MDGEEEVGYTWIEPGRGWGEQQRAKKMAMMNETSQINDSIKMTTGFVQPELLDLMLTSLPVDISLIDEYDRVVYYSANKDRIFPRSPGVIGRKVQLCHPSKSVATVNRILASFKNNLKDTAEFWFSIKDKFIYIQYIALRDAAGKYKGTLEMSQDISHLKTLEGTKKLLNWD